MPLYVPSYVDMCQKYYDEHPDQEVLLSMRDHLLPLVTRMGEFAIRVFDVEGEILDLGTPSNIQYVQDNWRHYT